MSVCVSFLAQMFLAVCQFLYFLRGFGMSVFYLGFGVLVTMVLRYMHKYLYPKEMENDPDLKDGWFGRGPRPIDNVDEDTTVRPFIVNVKDDVLVDLKSRLERTRLAEPVEDVKFLYGFSPNYLRQVVEYWKDDYNWRKNETLLNELPHFVTEIEGIDVHFLHVKPDVEAKKLEVIPLMIIHGWPGCFAEFYKIIPLLTKTTSSRGFVFEVICPSIPGYGFSEAPHKSGLTSRAAGRIFVKLMERIGHKNFYVQGGDLGSIIATNMAKFYPQRITGLHLNMFGFLSLWELLKLIAVSVVPFFVSKEEYRLVYPLRRKLRFAFQESGYFHIQSTKPDTLGCALSDSPAGLVAYLLEKFSVATNSQYVKREDGGLTEKFTMDELITNCMIYWVTNSFPSAARFYKENMKDFMKFEKYPVQVPTGVAAFPNEVLMYPRMMLTHQLQNMVSYTIMPKGGHFAAMEEPHLLAQDIWDFVEKVKNRPLAAN